MTKKIKKDVFLKPRKKSLKRKGYKAWPSWGEVGWVRQ
jgi:hypothetical protein